MIEVDKLPKGVEIHGKSIRITFMYRGKRCRETLKNLPVTKSNISFAERKRSAILHDIAMGIFDYGKYFPDSPKAQCFTKSKSRKTVEELLDDWMALAKIRCERSTWNDYQSIIKCYLKPELGNYYIDELSKADVKKWRASLSISNKRKNNILIPLRGVFELAEEERLIQINPLSTLKSLRIDKYSDIDPFTIDEIQALLSIMEGASRNMFQFAFWTGVRSSELIALAWEDIDLEAGTVHIQRAFVRDQYKDPKTAAGDRVIELLDPAIDALRKQKEITSSHAPVEIVKRTQSGKTIKENLRFVFYDEKTGKLWRNSTSYSKKVWRPTIKASGVRYRYSYQTRHTYASQLLTMGINPAWIAKQMGHEDWGMIRRVYAKWIPSEKSQQVAVINKLLSQSTMPQ